jgi:hypothetical protein
MAMDQTSDALFTRTGMRHELDKRGYKISKSYFDQICAPTVNAGPPVAKWWGKRPLYRLTDALAWAESRCSAAPGRLVA